MNNHILVPLIDLNAIKFPQEYYDWLSNWLSKNDSALEDGNASSSLCLQSCLAEIILYGKPKRDWDGVWSLYLTDDDGNPLAYSEKYGQRLYKFGNQWKQTPVHAIYTKYWFDMLQGITSKNLKRYSDLIINFIQPNGWIYNPKVSETSIRTRMKSEYLMSLAMGLEIIEKSGQLDTYVSTFVSTLSEFPLTGYISAEYFRLRSLEILKRINLLPAGLVTVLQDCQVGQGYCDFALKNKVDEYMGTAKRTSRDIALHSPLATLQAYYISRYFQDTDKEVVSSQALKHGKYLEKDPMGIPAFKIRDLLIPFGTDISPIEIISATWLRALI